MLSLSKFGLSEYAENTCFWNILTKITQKYAGFPLKIFFGGTLGTYTKKINPPSAVYSSGGWVHSKICWLIAYTLLTNHNYNSKM